MTVTVSKPALNLREELAALRAPNLLRYREQQFWFENLVTNGTFDSNASGWTLTRFTWSSGTILKDTSGTGDGNAGIAAQTFSHVPGQGYRVTFNILGYSAGVAYAAFRKIGLATNVQTADYSGNGNYSEVLRPSEPLVNSFELYTKTNANLAIDNVSIYPADTAGDAIHRLPAGWKPLHVYEDGLIQREGAAEDYTVVHDGLGNYHVKPAIAPGVATRTCIMGVMI